MRLETTWEPGLNGSHAPGPINRWFSSFNGGESYEIPVEGSGMQERMTEEQEWRSLALVHAARMIKEDILMFSPSNHPVHPCIQQIADLSCLAINSQKTWIASLVGKFLKKGLCRMRTISQEQQQSHQYQQNLWFHWWDCCKILSQFLKSVVWRVERSQKRIWHQVIDIVDRIGKSGLNGCRIWVLAPRLFCLNLFEVLPAMRIGACDNAADFFSAVRNSL